MIPKDKIKVGLKVQVESHEGIFQGIVTYWSAFCEDLTIEPGN